MAITTMDQLVAAFGASQFIDTYDASITALGAGYFESLWTAGGRPGPGATPATGAGAVPTNATAGALPYVNPGSGTGYLGRLSVHANTAGALLIHDRLVHTSGLSGIVTTAQTVNSTALTRYSGTASTNVGVWLEWYTATGGTAVTATVSYTNQSGTSGRTGTAALPASVKAGQAIPVSLASGDTGVQSVQSVTLSATTGTAGNFGITLNQRIATIPIPAANGGMVLDYAGVGMPVIQNNACLVPSILCSTTSTGVYVCEYTFISG